MVHPASISAALMTQGAQSAQAKPAIALWGLAAVFTVIAVTVALAEATLTPEQFLDVFVQTGMAP